MRKELIYIMFMLIFFASCEEYYTPKIDVVEGQLVVEALITNDLSQNIVHLTRTTSFYDKQPGKVVTGARVDLVEINGKSMQSFQSTESSPGYFNFNLIPVIGKNYKLRIYIDKDTYESDVVTMPPAPSITKFYTGHVEKKVFRTDGYGVPYALTEIGRELYVDAPVIPTLSCYRFNLRAVLEWMYAPLGMGPPPPPTFGWDSFQDYGQFNIAAPKKFSQSVLIEKHPLMTLPYDAGIYLKPDSIPLGWILIIDQYGTSRGSFDFHEKLNSQFSAEGTLFDPIQTQIYGNITCKTDASKIVYGYFDLNSWRQSRYFLRMSTSSSNVYQRQIFRYPFIPYTGTQIADPPDWWE